MDMAELTLEQRVQRIEDAEEIRRLRYLYCEYGNLYDAERFAALFAPDAIWDGGDAFGRQEGLEQIEQMVRDAGERIRFSAHYITNELIDVNGDSATGRWWLFMPCVLDGESTWLFATSLARPAQKTPCTGAPADGKLRARQADGSFRAAVSTIARRQHTQTG